MKKYKKLIFYNIQNIKIRLLFKNPFRISVILLFLFSFVNCIAIRVYVPKKGNISHNVDNSDTIPRLDPNFEVLESPTLKNETFAIRKPSLFFLAPEKLENEYGSVGTVIARELDQNRNDYKTDQKYKIHIKNFELKTIDRCFFGSKTEVKLNIEVVNPVNKKNVLDFQYEDSIDSNVTDCHFTLATVTVLGWLVYLPYLGFRGNREDQLNQLGKTALLEFFEKLKITLEQSFKPIPPGNR
ncbi:hypothetical protein QMM42_02025 [Leptospira santarosai]|uniref:Uncharacterized protein n=3 Tax=Leptospira santarosai TaxID=28183 RepID=M6UKM6_9LEPT|nr:hypothetical protein [Leptospira santarosai]EKS07703.1 hypothetical protein LEP1GSC071_3214 [Leptospira santarosai str. JET]EKT88278.1 hypothetical protein LSS_02759 [Leptospira santarosai serovar Shermani str. LT 821]EMM85373.1 hypothetical protein LEP1GSC039_0287 [Leptospira santarosai str. 2000027870]EMN22066.1 hypothetical protein LEP1GSC063_4329 [Leptospira santarosai serovar Arenal str. MAVJ 401]EMO45080.1 hypothetical protein LEP1GSC187_1655 [Leptospira santarosai str. ZUN179]